MRCRAWQHAQLHSDEYLAAFDILNPPLENPRAEIAEAMREMVAEIEASDRGAWLRACDALLGDNVEPFDLGRLILPMPTDPDGFGEADR